MKYTIPARPTTYADINFRSELEAAWAAWFDLRYIKWDYEPLVSFAYWRPDFLISFPLYEKDGQKDEWYAPGEKTGEGKIFVEVKPFTTIDQWVPEVVNKIQPSIDDELILLLGLGPEYIRSNCKFAYHGWPPMYGCSETGGDPEEDWKKAKNIVRWKP